MNAPNSFHEDGVGIDAYPPESMIVPAVVIDVREQAEADADYQLSVDDILAWEGAHGRYRLARVRVGVCAIRA